MTERRFTGRNKTIFRPGKQPVNCHQSLSLWVRDIFASFLMAFLFHLIPSIIWGAENSLGTPSNHQMMGAVWFLGWPIFGCLLLGATFQKKGIIVEKHDEESKKQHFIQLTFFQGNTHEQVARAIKSHLGLLSSEEGSDGTEVLPSNGSGIPNGEQQL